MGALLDKALDVIFWILLFPSLGYVLYRDTGDIFYVHAAFVTTFLLTCRRYFYWVWRLSVDHAAGRGVDFERMVLKMLPTQEKLQKMVAEPSVRPGYFKQVLVKLPRLLLFDEADIFFFCGLFLILGRPDLLLWVVMVGSIWQMLYRQIVRLLSLHNLDTWFDDTPDPPITSAGLWRRIRFALPLGRETMGIGPFWGVTASSFLLAGASLALLYLDVPSARWIVPVLMALKVLFDNTRARWLGSKRAYSRLEIYMHEQWSGLFYGSVVYLLALDVLAQGGGVGWLFVGVAAGSAFVAQLYMLQVVSTMNPGAMEAELCATGLLRLLHRGTYVTMAHLGILCAAVIALGTPPVLVAILSAGLVLWMVARFVLTLVLLHRLDLKI